MLAGDALDHQMYGRGCADVLESTAKIEPLEHLAASAAPFERTLSILPDLELLEKEHVLAPTVVTDKPDYAPGATAMPTSTIRLS